MPSITFNVIDFIYRAAKNIIAISEGSGMNYTAPNLTTSKIQITQMMWWTFIKQKLCMQKFVKRLCYEF